MLSPTTIGLFALAAFIFAITPGPDMLYIVARSIAQGRGAGVMSALGIQAGSLVHTVAAAVGLSALVSTSTIAFGLVKYVGAAYLIYLGIRTLLSEAENLHIHAGKQKNLKTLYLSTKNTAWQRPLRYRATTKSITQRCTELAQRFTEKKQGQIWGGSET